MPSKLPRTLQDIKENIDLAQSFVANMSFAEFQSDRRTLYAVVRCLEIVSEASRRLPLELKARHLSIQWDQIASAGNIYRHGYDLVRDDLLWNTVKNALEPLRVAVDEELGKLTDQ